MMYVRGKYQIAEDNNNTPITTERLTLEQLIQIYGEEVTKRILKDIDDRGGAVRPDVKTEELWHDGPPTIKG